MPERQDDSADQSAVALLKKPFLDPKELDNFHSTCNFKKKQTHGGDSLNVGWIAASKSHKKDPFQSGFR